jgi:hypothetical protein
VCEDLEDSLSLGADLKAHTLERLLVLARYPGERSP